MNWEETQNQDGGWSYRRGTSWTEPTAFVLLAQSANPAESRVRPAGLERGVQFLKSLQREDGGWSPQRSVSESTWITSVAALLPDGMLEPERRLRANAWLLEQTGMESGWQWKLRQRLAGNHEEFPDGWAWFPGAAAWVIPTSLGLLAFEKALKKQEDRKIRERVESARRFLLAHMCADGGWNHGGNRALGRDGESYPETTGIALLALHAAEKSPQLERAKQAARKHLASCRMAEGTAWLRMGLQAHGEKHMPSFEPVCRSTMDYALIALAQAERNPLCT